MGVFQGCSVNRIAVRTVRRYTDMIAPNLCSDLEA